MVLSYKWERMNVSGVRPAAGIPIWLLDLAHSRTQA